MPGQELAVLFSDEIKRTCVETLPFSHGEFSCLHVKGDRVFSNLYTQACFHSVPFSGNKHHSCKDRQPKRNKIFLYSHENVVLWS